MAKFQVFYIVFAHFMKFFFKCFTEHSSLFFYRLYQKSFYIAEKGIIKIKKYRIS